MKKLLVAVLVLMSSSFAMAERTKIQGDLSVNGHFQFRTESAQNRQNVQGSKQMEQSFSRLRVYFQFTPNENLTFNYTPQATKGFGAVVDSETTSGSTNHTEVTSFESNIDYKISDNLSAKLGRQELSYGDHLFIGSLPWANAGRSFDAVKLHHKLSNGWVDLLHSKISNNDTDISSEQDDKDLYLLYSSINFDSAVKLLDLYLLHQNDNTASDLEVNMVGFRLKGEVGAFFFRTENGKQTGENLDGEAYQYGLELGGKFGKYSAAVEYSIAGKDYQQLYPTAHKFMGITDVLGRRNLQQTALHIKGAPLDYMNFSLDMHQFQRVDDENPAYKLNGSTSWGTTGDSTDIGSEVDLVVNL